jgi:uncharacterized protein (TIGR02217 family)
MSEDRFPVDISYGAQGGPGFNTSVRAVASGRESRNKNWSIARGKWDVSHGVKNEEQADRLRSFFYSVAQGMFNTFRFKDWSDYAATVSNGYLDESAGDGTPIYQLYKKYTFGSSTYTRTIHKPVAGTLTVTRNGSPVTAGASAGNYSVDTTTGTITFVADASSAVSSITVGATTSVVLAANPGTLTNGQKLYLNGFTGANASAVNGKAHTITNISGSGPYTFTLNTNTAGMTITLGSGVGYKYPQASDVLLWAGEFDCNVRFATDDFNLRIVDKNLYSWEAIPVVEVLI